MMAPIGGARCDHSKRGHVCLTRAGRLQPIKHATVSRCAQRALRSSVTGEMADVGRKAAAREGPESVVDTLVQPPVVLCVIMKDRLPCKRDDYSRAHPPRTPRVSYLYLTVRLVGAG